MKTLLPFLRRIAGAAALSLSAVLMAYPALAQPEEVPSIRVPASPLPEALQAFSDQTGVTVIFSETLVAGRASGGVRSAPDREAALVEILRGTGLEAVPGAGGYVIREQSGTGSGTTKPTQPPARLPDESGNTGQEDRNREADLRIEQVVVTGTSLRGIAPESSPLQIYTRDDILGSGVTTTEQFIRTLPQNFGGGSTEFLPGGLPNDDSSSRNDAYGSGVNIRGLGSGATLTLLNGRRVAPSSTIGGFADVSLFPITAIERVDVLTDGASSIYGADAVGGVVNFILRKDFDGAETSARYGTVTSGNMDEYRISQTLGRSWGKGNLLATYEYGSRDNLSLSDRPEIAAPLLYSGAPLPETFEYDLLPKQERHSVLLAGSHDFLSGLRFSGTGLYALRKAAGNSYSATNSGNWTFNEPTTELMSFNFGADYEVSPSLSIALESGYSQVRTHTRSERRAPSLQTITPRVSLSELWSAGMILNARVLKLPGGDVQIAIGGQYRQEDFINRAVWSGTVSRDGSRDVGAIFGEVQLPLFGDGNQIPGVRRLEANLSVRSEEYSDFGSTTNPKFGLLWSPVENLNIRSTYSTSYAPPPLGRTGALDQAAQVAPYAWLRNIYGIPLPDSSLADVNYLTANGTGRGLGPETSSAFTAGLDWQWTNGPSSADVRLTYYDTSFKGRLGTTPVPGGVNSAYAPGLAFTDPDLFPEGTIVFFPTDAEVQQFLEDYAAQTLFYSGGLSSVENIGFLNYVGVVRNLARTETNGFDLDLSYARDVSRGTISAGINANYILDFTQQAGSATPAVKTLDTLYNPSSLKLRGKFGYSGGNWAVNTFVNYTDSYSTDLTATARPVGSWTTIDLNLSYEFGQSDGRWLDDLMVGLSVLNLSDQAPPRAPAAGQFRITGYDPTNASPLGRFVAVEFRKAF